MQGFLTSGNSQQAWSNLGLAANVGAAQQQYQVTYYPAYYNTTTTQSFDPLFQTPNGKKPRFIVELREELRKWHGDIYSVLN